MGSDDKATEDHSVESCADDSQNASREPEDFKSDEQDSIIDASGCGPVEESGSSHATNTVKTAMHTASIKDVVMKCARITIPTGSHPPRRRDFRH